MKYTIKDVAKEANVSIATVSRIINNLPGYSEETKRKVLEAIERLGYQPNAIARGLINRRTQTIGVLFPDVSSMFSSEILNGIENAAHDNGHSVIVCHTASNGRRTLKYLNLLHEKRVDGVVFVSEVMTEEYYKTLSNMKVPVVLLSTESLHYPFPFVRVNDKHAAYTATSYLIDKGHIKIGMISGNLADPIAGQPRVDGYKEALAQHGLMSSENNIVYGEGFSYKEGLECLPKLLNQVPDLTAIFAASDEIAIGAIAAAYQWGIKIPEQLSIIGYDNLKIAEMSVPPLTTVAQPLFEMGETSANMLFQMLEKGDIVESRIMPHQIIERRSVKQL